MTTWDKSDFVLTVGMVLCQEALKRILFIFAKLNPGIRYVQGMNEVLAPLYYVFKTDKDEDNAVSAIVSCCSVQGGDFDWKIMISGSLHSQVTLMAMHDVS